VAHGARGVLAPTLLKEGGGGPGGGGAAVVAEVELYGDTVLRYVSGDWQVGQPGLGLPSASNSIPDARKSRTRLRVR
jgi:hypothetical protein